MMPCEVTYAHRRTALQGAGGNKPAADAGATAPAQHRSGHASPHAGVEARAITSHSQAYPEELRRGGGWGRALAAELNGVPGPAHLLELAAEIPLSADQVAAIRQIFEAMQAEAIAAGARLIAAEEAIEAAFRAGDFDAPRLRSLIAEAGAARGKLRFIHRRAISRRHRCRTPGRSRAATPCAAMAPPPGANVPEGHNPEMWRRHNNCGRGSRGSRAGARAAAVPARHAGCPRRRPGLPCRGRGSCASVPWAGPGAGAPWAALPVPCGPAGDGHQRKARAPASMPAAATMRIAAA